MPKINFDTLLVSRRENIRYLSGFSGEGLLLIKNFGRKQEKKVLLTDPRYLLLAREEKKAGWQIKIADQGTVDAFTATLKELKTKKLGFEARHATVAQLAAMKKKTRKLKVKFIPTEQEIEKRREIKTSTEIQKIQKACQIGVKVLRAVLKNIKVGKTELEVAAEIAMLAARFGAEKLSFEPVVAFGSNSACPHAKPGKRKLKKGDVVLLDLGVVYAGYCSDMTRTFFTAEPTKQQREVYAAVLAAQKAGLAAIRAKAKTAAVDAAVRAELQSADLEKFFTHSTGHGVGLQIHEAPSLAAKSKEVLQVGMIVTCEPGVYLENQFGVRIEDSVVVIKSGVKIFTNFSKKLQILKLKN